MVSCPYSKRIAIFLFIMLLLQIVSAIPADISAQSFESNFFSIAFISDTQYLSSSAPYLYESLTQWLVNNSQYYNIKLVVHTGDIVDDMNNDTQWAIANRSMSYLSSAGIPYCWTAGNHDQYGSKPGYGNPNQDWRGSYYPSFNPSIQSMNSYWVSDLCDGKNTAVKFNFDRYNFLCLSLEYNANSTTLNWANGIIQESQRNNYNVIIATHSFINQSGLYASEWATSLNYMLDKYPNIFLTLSGHYGSETKYANHIRINNREELFFNRQSMDWPKGSASAQIITFYPSSMLTTVETYVVYKNIFLTDQYAQFSFDTSFISSDISTYQPPIVTQSPQPYPTPYLTQAPLVTSAPSLTCNPTTQLTAVPTELTPSPLPSVGEHFDPILFLILVILPIALLAIKKRKSDCT